MKNLKKRASALVIALITLAILTVVGLSLTLVTQTEKQLGDTEKTINEQFYAVEAGTAAQMSTLLVTRGVYAQNLVIPGVNPRQSSDTPITVGYDVVTSGLQQVSESEMGYSKANEGRDSGVKLAYFHMKSMARQTGWPKANPVPTCAEIKEFAMGQTVTQVGFLSGPFMGGTTTGEDLRKMMYLDNDTGLADAEADSLRIAVSDCYESPFAEITNESGNGFPKY